MDSKFPSLLQSDKISCPEFKKILERMAFVYSSKIFMGDYTSAGLIDSEVRSFLNLLKNEIPGKRLFEQFEDYYVHQKQKYVYLRAPSNN